MGTETKLASPQITTLMAEINVVKIGNKQMTISVFNQLYEEKCFDENFNILYPIWGRVNREIEYVIFQKGSDLRKMPMPKKGPLYSFETSFVGNISVGNYGTHIRINIKDIMMNDADRHKRILEAQREAQRVSNSEAPAFSWYKIVNDYIKNDGLKLVNDALLLFTEEELKKIKEDYRINRAKQEIYNQMVKELQNSPQLFIAV